MDISEKVRHVREAKQTRSHACHWPGCEVQVPPARWGCKVHWYRLPSTLRSMIWESYEPGQEVDGTPSENYIAAAKSVQKWIEDNVPAEHRGAKDADIS